jgi:hypothetical protein
MALVVSTSGKSPNLVYALEEARERKMQTIAWAGKDGGRFRQGSLRPGEIASRMASILARQNSLRLDGDTPIPLPFLCHGLSHLFGSGPVRPKSW